MHYPVLKRKCLYVQIQPHVSAKGRRLHSDCFAPTVKITTNRSLSIRVRTLFKATCSHDVASIHMSLCMDMFWIGIVTMSHGIDLKRTQLLNNCAITCSTVVLQCYRRQAIPMEQGKIRPSVTCLLYTSPSPRDGLLSRMPSSA